MQKDTMKRSIVKTFFFKLVTTSITAMITGLGNAIVIHVAMTIIYIIYERIWNRINWGRKSQTNEMLRNEQEGQIYSLPVNHQPV